MTRRGVLFLVLGVIGGVVIALILLVLILRGGPIGGVEDPDDPAAEEHDDPAAEERPRDDVEDPDREGPRFDGPTTSASTGPEGTRDLDQVPDELPTALVVDDAVDLEATVARGGEDWSASLTYRTAQDPEALAAAVDDVLAGEGYTLRRRSSDDLRTTTVYDGQDRSVLTTTVLVEEPMTLVHVVRVSP